MTKKILIIDDEEDVVEIIKTTLKTKGYQTFHAYDGEEGYKRVVEIMPDLIILDLMMPKVSGLELNKRLQKNEKTSNIPIIVMSALGKDAGKTEDFWKAGLKVEEFLSKPFDTFDLLGRVETIFRSDQYISTQQAKKINGIPAGADQSTEPLPQAPSPQIDLPTARPKEVVKAFVESWNARDFGLEFDCLAPQLQVMEKQQYISNRVQTWEGDKSEQVSQHVTEILDEFVEGDTCKVTIKRADSRRGRERQFRQQFILQQIPEGWKITQMKMLA